MHLAKTAELKYVWKTCVGVCMVTDGDGQETCTDIAVAHCAHIVSAHCVRNQEQVIARH